VISSFRCRKRASGPEHARVRLAKTAVHEIGHTLGLAHCPRRGCLMEDAEGSVLTSDREFDLCADCRARLRAAGHAAREPTTIPWPRPAAPL
jgi:archaemetzincin